LTGITLALLINLTGPARLACPRVSIVRRVARQVDDRPQNGWNHTEGPPSATKVESIPMLEAA